MPPYGKRQAFPCSFELPIFHAADGKRKGFR